MRTGPKERQSSRPSLAFGTCKMRGRCDRSARNSARGEDAAKEAETLAIAEYADRPLPGPSAGTLEKNVIKRTVE